MLTPKTHLKLGLIAGLLVSPAALAQPQPIDPGAPTGPAPAPGPGVAPAPGAPAQPGFTFGGSTSTAPADTGAAPAPAPVEEEKPKKLFWRRSSVLWDHSVTTDTVGVGQDRQSSNPTYDMTIEARPRFYVYSDDVRAFSVRPRMGAFREFTNSDSTTDRGEWSATDFSLTALYSQTVKEWNDETALTFGAAAPNFSFPTSRASRNNGKILGLGTSVSLAQDFPLLGGDSPVLQVASVTVQTGYSHTLTQAETAVADEPVRVRMGRDGIPQASDQLGGAALAKHNLPTSIALDVAVADIVSVGTNFGWTPVWRYTFDSEIDPCESVNVVGCPDGSTVQQVEDPQNYSVISNFGASVSVEVTKPVELSASYSNVTLAIGPDGQRRNMFYSPAARFGFTAVVFIDSIYTTIRDSQAEKKTARVSPRPLF